MSEPIHILSLGAGVQSSTMALMAACGELKPMPNAAIFADTGDEPKAVYEWLAWLEKQLPFKTYRVTAGRLSDFALDMRTSKKSGNTYLKIGLPVYTDSNGKKGMGMRQCTRSFKIDPIRKQLRALRNGGKVIQWIGISYDEVSRMRDSRDRWCTNIWPLVDKRMTRHHCLDWMALHKFPVPPRSACTYCPFHSDAEWQRLRNDDPQAFKDAAAFEKKLQDGYAKATALHSIPFLHSSRRPLEEVEFKDKLPSLFENECEGMCGV